MMEDYQLPTTPKISNDKTEEFLFSPEPMQSNNTDRINISRYIDTNIIHLLNQQLQPNNNHVENSHAILHHHHQLKTERHFKSIDLNHIAIKHTPLSNIYDQSDSTDINSNNAFDSLLQKMAHHNEIPKTLQNVSISHSINISKTALHCIDYLKALCKKYCLTEKEICTIYYSINGNFLLLETACMGFMTNKWTELEDFILANGTEEELVALEDIKGRDQISIRKRFLESVQLK